MNIFCLFWIPLFYLFWCSLPGKNKTGAGWAFIIGILASIGHIFLEPLFDPGKFEFSRWLSGFIIAVLPVILPLFIYFFLVFFGIVKDGINYPGFALAWLIPAAIINALRWSSLRDPILLLLIPLLWTSLATGIPLFIGFIKPRKVILTILASFGILALPLTAASSYWAFFSHMPLNGIIFLIITAVPMLISVVLSFFQGKYSS